MMPRDQGQPVHIAVLEADSDAGRRAIEARLAGVPDEDIRRFAASDGDKLNDAVCAGDVACVLFANMETLLEGIWNGDFEFAEWMDAGIRIELVEPGFDETVATQAALSAFYRSVADWRTRQRRKKLIAAVILSAVALLCLTTFYLLIQRPPL